MIHPRPALRRPGSRIAAALLAAIVALGASPLPAPAAQPAGDPGALPVAPLGAVAQVPPADPAAPPAADAVPDPAAIGQPSVAYEQAMAHADDPNTFEPGGRVDVPFRPRAGDVWTVDGKAPRELPAGRASGRDMERTPQGTVWAEPGSGDAPRDGGNGRGGETPAPGPTTAPDPAAAPSEPAPSASTETPIEAPLSPSPAPSSDAPSPSDSPSPSESAEPTPAPVDAPGNESPIPATSSGYAVPGADLTVAPAASAALSHQVFGFLPYWELASGSSLDYDVLSTIAYFSVGADKYGNLLKKSADGTTTTGWSGWTSSRMTSVITNAHANGTRVVLTVTAFAWTTSQAATQKALLGSSTARLNLAKQIAAAVRDRGADGVNLDFEPLASGYETQFVSLLKTVRAEMNKVAAGYQLTYDTTGWIGNYPLEASVAAGAADAIFIMGYDYRTASSGYVGSIDPLAGPAYDLADTVRAYTARVPGSKIILGVPWYGRAWSTVSDAVNAKNQSGTKYGASTAVNYETVVDLVAKYGRRWDTREYSPWFAYQRQNCTTTYGCVTSWRQVYYDDAASLKLRYQLVHSYGLRGAGIWALGYDGARPEMKQALAESFLAGAGGPVVGIDILATKQPDEGFVVTWSAAAPASIAAYDVQVSVDGGPWAAWLTGTTATSEVHLGRDGRGYAFRVRAKDTSGAWSFWNVTSVYTASPALAVGAFGRARIEGLAYRSGPSTGATKLGELPIGTIMAITGGPVSADGFTWWQVTQPIREWGTVSAVQRGVWVAGRSSTESYVAPYRVPNGTVVDAGLAGFGVGTGVDTASSGDASHRTFSPNGDGSRDQLPLRWTNAVALTSLTLNVYRTDGSLVGSRSVGALAAGARTWGWDGTLDGSRVPDGTYVLQLVGTDGTTTFRAPSARPVTPAQVAAFGVTVDTVAPVITSASTSGTIFSPNGDGIRDTLSVAFATTGMATWWRLHVATPSGTGVRTISGSGGAGTATWDGRTNGGGLAPDGTYTIAFASYDAAGNGVRRYDEVTLDRTAPVVVAKATPVSFSPDGDGALDRTTLSWASSESASGVVRIYKGTTLIRSWSVSARTGWSVAWDGRSGGGTLQADGRYRYRVDVRDGGGTQTIVDTTVTLDRTAGYLRWSRSFYPQDGDALAPNSVVSFKLIRQATTTLRILDATGAVVRTAWTNRVLPAGTPKWTWDGRSATGAYVAPGRYVAELTATTVLGTVRLTRTVIADGFTWSLSASTVRPGQTLTVAFRTVEPLSTRPTVTFYQPGRAYVRVTATKLTDGSYRAAFTVAPGPAGVAAITIAARDSSGGVNVSRPSVVIAP